MGHSKTQKNSTLPKLFPETTAHEAISRLFVYILLPALFSFTCDDSHVNTLLALHCPLTTIQHPTNS